jgi:hypothetical protein
MHPQSGAETLLSQAAAPAAVRSQSRSANAVLALSLLITGDLPLCPSPAFLRKEKHVT